MCKISKAFNSIKNDKRNMYIFLSILLILFSMVLNVAFGAFTETRIKAAANLKVKSMNYALLINGVSDTVIAASASNTTKSNISVTSLNNMDSKYELIYHVCADSSCTNYIEKPNDLEVFISSRSKDALSGIISYNEAKSFRVVAVNSSSNTYFIKIDINAGYSYNTLALQNMFGEIYNEEDVLIASYIDDVLSDSFPSSGLYQSNVVCGVNGEASTAKGNAIWNGTSWVINIIGASASKTSCNVYFTTKTATNLKDTILANNGGVSAITSKTTPNFGTKTTTNEGMFATTDDYGTTYYFRGMTNNNWVLFNDMYWRIVRIDGNGSIKMIYSGKEAPTEATSVIMTGKNTMVGTSAFREEDHYTGDNAYSGYTYFKGQLRSNINSSTIKNYVDNWYNYTITTDNQSKIADAIYCGDRTPYIASGTFPNYTYSSGGGTGTTATSYGANTRFAFLVSPVIPIDTCPVKDDAYTTTDTTHGNGALTYPVGLITADEAIFAGNISNNTSQDNYLNNNLNYFTMTPAYFANKSYLYIVSNSGGLQSSVTSDDLGVRPVIALSNSVTSIGDGTWNNPYVIQ